MCGNPDCHFRSVPDFVMGNRHVNKHQEGGPALKICSDETVLKRLALINTVKTACY